MNHKEFDAAFYNEHKKLVETTVAIAHRWAQRGRSEAAAGMSPLTLGDFIRWTNRLSKDQGGDVGLAELMYECYMEGYNAGKAAA